MSEAQLNAALDLMRRLPPSKVEESLAGLIDLVPDLCDDLLASVDQPLKVLKDSSNREFLICDYNRDGDSYRSPWTNEYVPSLPDGCVPSDQLRDFELQANEVFDSYRDTYYEGGLSSVYAWEVDGGFAVCILIKKNVDQARRGLNKGGWDAIHVAEVLDADSDMPTYKLTSTVMLTMDTTQEKTGDVSLCGSLTRQREMRKAVSERRPHVVNIGELVEDQETKLRSTLYDVYFGRMKDVLDSIRSRESLESSRSREEAKASLAAELSRPN